MGTGGIALSRTAAKALGDTVHGRIVFHSGLWGAETCVTEGEPSALAGSTTVLAG